MKHITNIFILIFLFSLNVNAQEWTNNYPKKELTSGLFDIHLFDQTTAIATGSKSTTLKTNDGGQTWDIQTLNPYKEVFNSVFFVNNNVGWLVGRGSNKHGSPIYKTTDGGSTWIRQESGTNYELTSVRFIDNNTGWVIGVGGVILKTDNGGDNWVAQQSNTDYKFTTLQSIYLENKNEGIVVGTNGRVRMTTNGGDYWNALGVDTKYDLFHVCYTDSLTRWIVGKFITIDEDHTLFLKTTDKGETWRPISVLDYNLNSVFFINSDVGWAVGTGGVIFKTIDGGNSWHFQNSLTSSTLNSVKFYDADNGWITSGDGKILRTIDGGETWFGVINQKSKPLYSIRFVNNNFGCAVGGDFDRGVVLLTNNSGLNWTYKQDPILNQTAMYSNCFINSQTGWIIGWDKIYKTNNGGVSWTQQTTDITDGFSDIQFYDQNIGWIVGKNGVILKTTDSGDNWESISSGVSEELCFISFINSKIGWLSGGNGTILKTITGGNTWTIQESGNSNKLNSLFFIDDMLGWSVGNNGIILNTMDGGVNWSSQQTETMENINSIYFINSRVGWAAGSNGTILRTINRGASWEFQENNISAVLTSIFFTDDNTGWITGEDGSIYKTETGGITWVEEIIETNNENPDDFILYQNYPNPFNSSTSIQFSLCKPGYVTLKIFDILGQEIDLLISDKRDAGKYKVKWHANNFASGTYFYRLEIRNTHDSISSNIVKIKKLILQK